MHFSKNEMRAFFHTFISPFCIFHHKLSVFSLYHKGPIKNIFLAFRIMVNPLSFLQVKSKLGLVQTAGPLALLIMSSVRPPPHCFAFKFVLMRFLLMLEIPPWCLLWTSHQKTNDCPGFCSGKPWRWRKDGVFQCPPALTERYTTPSLSLNSSVP